MVCKSYLTEYQVCGWMLIESMATELGLCGPCHTIDNDDHASEGLDEDTNQDGYLCMCYRPK